MSTTAPKLDDVELVPAETIAFWAVIEHSEDELTCRLDENRAAYRYRCRGCGDEFLLCTSHQRHSLLVEAIKRLRCDYCKTIFPRPIPWLPL